MSKKTIKASAPGRLDVMGGIADYSGSLVLQKAITQQTHIELTLRDDYRCIITSRLNTGEILTVDQDFRANLKNGEVDYSFAQQAFKKNLDDAWSAYVLGCALVLQREKGIRFAGANIHLQSEVPNGKGVASSASVEVVTMQAFEAAFNLSFSGTELAVLAQRVENLIAGAPCGLMDQLACSFGKSNTLLPIICQPDRVQKEIAIPPDISFIGIDSGIRHQVAGASYSDVRCAAFMGYTIIAQSMGISNQELLLAKQHQNFSSLPFHGYLSNIHVEEFENQFKRLVPDALSGEEFLKQFGNTIDSATIVDKKRMYSVKPCTAHPVYENYRVHQFQDYLFNLNATQEPNVRKTIVASMGTLMLESHISYSQCGLGTDRTDEIVSLAINKKGIFGARITGGGNGGTVCLLACGKEGYTSAIGLHVELCDRYGQNLELFN